MKNKFKHFAAFIPLCAYSAATFALPAGPFSIPQYAEVDCGGTQPVTTSVTCDNGFDGIPNASFTNPSNLKSGASIVSTNLQGNTYTVVGEIRGLDRVMFNCPGGGHATLVVSGTCK